MVSEESKQARTSSERRGSSLFPRPRCFELLSFPPYCSPRCSRPLPAARPTEHRCHSVLTSPTGFKMCKCLSVLLLFPHGHGSPFSLPPFPQAPLIHQLLLCSAFDALFFSCFGLVCLLVCTCGLGLCSSFPICPPNKWFSEAPESPSPREAAFTWAGRL